MQQLHNNTKPAADLDNMAVAACGLYCLSLWPAITEEEAIATKQQIRSILLNFPDQYAGYVELIQRINLIKEYIRLYGPAHCSPRPCDWLTANGSFALSSTWYRAMEKKRQDKPLYKLEWKGLAEAFLEITEEINHDLFQYWNTWFLKRNAITEQVLFHKYIVHLNALYEIK